MYDLKKNNLSLFLFILFFNAFAILLIHLSRIPADSAEQHNISSYMESLDVFAYDNWQEREVLPVTRQEAALLFQQVEQNRENFRDYLTVLVNSGVFPSRTELDEWLSRRELYHFVCHFLSLPADLTLEEYFLGSAGEGYADLLGHLGIIEVPSDRQYRAQEVVSRQEIYSVLARAAIPALRDINAPVIVQPRQLYTYDIMTGDLQRMAAVYPELLTLQVIGESVEGRKIYAVRLGRGEREIFLDASIHANEWLTTPLLMKMLEEYAHHASFALPYGDFDLTFLLQDVSFWFIPMLNPDGVTLVLEGPEALKNEALARELQQKHGSADDFTDWKANIRGVDLNRQFPSGWQGMVNFSNVPSPSHYRGETPLSEPEARALYDFTLERRPAAVMSYHQQGEIVFWYYRQQGEQLQRDRHFVRVLAELTGYDYEFYLVNGGKYRDWLITELGIPAVIMEVGRRIGDMTEWERIWRQNRYAGVTLAQLVLKQQ